MGYLRKAKSYHLYILRHLKEIKDHDRIIGFKHLDQAIKDL